MSIPSTMVWNGPAAIALRGIAANTPKGSAPTMLAATESGPLDDSRVLRVDRALVEELISADHLLGDEEYLRVAVDIGCRNLGAGGAVAELHPPSELGEPIVIAHRVDEGIARALLSIAGERSEQLQDACGCIVRLDEFVDLDGTLLLDSLRCAGATAVAVFPVLRGASESIGVVYFLFTGDRVPDEPTRASTACLIRRVSLTLERNWIARRAEATVAHMQAVLDGAFDAILTIDRDGMIVSANRTTQRKFGHPVDALTGLPLSCLIPELGDRTAMKAAHRDAPWIAERDGILRETEAVRRDGTRFPIECSMSPVVSGGFRTLIIRDISKRREAEARLREADRLSMLGTLAAGLGHDMNNVLLPIRAHLNALEGGIARGTADDPRASARSRRSHVAEIRGGVSYLQHLADSLHFLALDPDASLDVGTTDLDAWWRQVGPLLSKAVHRVATLEVEIEEGLPPVAVPGHALTRAMLNLLVNARDAMPAARPHQLCRVRIVARRSEDPTELSIEVIDNGVGMSPEVQRRALEMFYTTKTRGLGTGLGLSLVQGVVDRAGGRLEMTSAEGAGTTMRMRLPTAAETSCSLASRAYVEGFDGRTVGFLRIVLARHGFEVVRGTPAGRCEVCIVGGSTLDARLLAQWARDIPSDRIIVIGDPPSVAAAEIERLGVTVLRDAADLGAVEAALERAVGSLGPAAARPVQSEPKSVGATGGVDHLASSSLFP
ncbi:MAG: ATP-binding protein [Planctomycetaceae bacterium]|nr:ATP-binding protein [Planctomycetaceae bacterium]